MSASANTWASIRPEDGSALRFSFDWHDDYSSWRFDELTDEIAEASSVCLAAGAKVETPSNLYDLEPIVKTLRGLYVNDAVDDATVRRGLVLADALDIPMSLLSEDANLAFEDVIADLESTIEAWDDAHAWTFTDDDFDTSAIRVFEWAKNRYRDGMGDRWSIEIDDDEIRLHEGTVVYGFNPPAAVIELFERLRYDVAYVGDESSVAKVFAFIDPAIVGKLSELIDAFANLDSFSVDHEDISAMAALITRHPGADDFERITETVAVLASDWSQSNTDLLRAAEAFVVEPALPRELVNT
jgi:hypothetical protein